jgi:hypothetical protein
MENAQQPQQSKTAAQITGVMVVICILCLAATAMAAGSNGLPPGLTMAKSSLDRVEQIVLPEIDIRPLLAEDQARDARRDQPVRFAKPIEVFYTSDTAGSWEQLDNGSLVWRLRISSPGAISLNVGITRFDLPAGGRLWVYDSDGELVQGPYTAADRSSDGSLWPAMVLGDQLIIEVHLASAARADTIIEIGRVNHGYRFFGEQATGKQGACNIDVACSEGDGWRRQIRSVGWYTLEGYETCSGVMVNNTAGDLTPYFLTAWHCGITRQNDSSMVVYWSYQSPRCGQLSGGSLAQNQSGATLRAELDEWESDFALVELDRRPDASFNVYYAGWDATGTRPGGAVGIHHPDTREKAISIDDDRLSELWGTHWEVGWDQGVTEPGSSGSPIFDIDNGLVIGTLTGGDSSCANPRATDYYGKLSLSFTGGGSSSSRLKDWLDPGNTGKKQHQGRESGSGGGGGGTNNEPTWLIPAAASSPGATSSDSWRSQLSVVNTTSTARTISIYYVGSGKSWPGTRLSGPHVIQARRSFYIDDPLRQHSPTSGLLYVTADGPGTMATSRLYNRGSNGATFGQGIPAIATADASAPAEQILPMVHSVPSRYRANLGLVQAATGRFEVEVTVYSANGSQLARKRYSTSAAFRQVNDLFRDMSIGNRSVEGGWIKVRLTSSAKAGHFWTCYVSVIDQRTGDPTYVTPQ